MQNGVIPASIHCDAVNEDITEKSRIQVVVRNQRWDPERAKIAGISSFGVGGVNAHVILI
jgi:acyl transferase domain-containing protein